MYHVGFLLSKELFWMAHPRFLLTPHWPRLGLMTNLSYRGVWKSGMLFSNLTGVLMVRKEWREVLVGTPGVCRGCPALSFLSLHPALPCVSAALREIYFYSSASSEGMYYCLFTPMFIAMECTFFIFIFCRYR